MPKNKSNKDESAGKITTDHETIRRWAEERDGTPPVKATHPPMKRELRRANSRRSEN
jgi:hypothetical protein